MKEKTRRALAILAVISLLLTSALPVAAENAACTEDHDHSQHSDASFEDEHIHTDDCGHETSESIPPEDHPLPDDAPEENLPPADSGEEPPANNDGDEPEISPDDTGDDREKAPDLPESYKEYFSKERDFWHYLRPKDSPYNWIHYEDTGDLYWAGPGGSKKIAEKVTRLMLGSEAAYYVVDETQLYGAALDNSWNYLIYEGDVPITTVWGNAEIVFFEVVKMVYRHHVASGITDVFYELGPKDVAFVPYSNHSIWWGEVVWEDELGNREFEYKYYSELTQTVTEPPEDFRFRVGVPVETYTEAVPFDGSDGNMPAAFAATSFPNVLQSAYPPGSFFATDSNAPCTDAGNSCLSYTPPTCTIGHSGIQCEGFSNYVYYNAFGECAQEQTWHLEYNGYNGVNFYMNLPVGTWIRSHSGSHSWIVADKTLHGITVYDANMDYKCGVWYNYYTYEDILTAISGWYNGITYLFMPPAEEQCTTHTFSSWAEAIPGTCTNPSKERRICTSCGVVEERSGSVPGHRWSTPAACATTITCLNGCGATNGATLPHNFSIAATCTTARKCSLCGQTDASSSPLNHLWGQGVLIGDVSCNGTELYRYTCLRANCGAIKSEGQAGPGHNWSAWSTITYATCATTGVRERVCTRCYTVERGTIGIIAHNYSDWTVLSNATCTSSGSWRRVCYSGGEYSYYSPPALGHSFSSATCTSASRCSRCGTTTGSAWGHNYTVFAGTSVYPTCTSQGLNIYRCSRCSATTAVTVSAYGHSYSAATCTSARRCTRCGVTSGSALGHNWVTVGTYAIRCTRCNQYIYF